MRAPGSNSWPAGPRRGNCRLKGERATGEMRGTAGGARECIGRRAKRERGGPGDHARHLCAPESTVTHRRALVRRGVSHAGRSGRGEPRRRSLGRMTRLPAATPRGIASASTSRSTPSARGTHTGGRPSSGPNTDDWGPGMVTGRTLNERPPGQSRSSRSAVSVAMPRPSGLPVLAWRYASAWPGPSAAGTSRAELQSLGRRLGTEVHFGVRR